MISKKMLIAVLAIVLMVGVVFASYNFLSGTVDVTIDEPFKVSVNYVGWEAPPYPAEGPGGYYIIEGDTFTCTVSLMAGETTNGDPNAGDLPTRESMPLLRITSPHPFETWEHTFNSIAVSNDAGVPITVTFVVTGETEDVYMVTWEENTVYRLNGYSCEVPADGFIMRGFGVEASADAAPGSYTFTVQVSRG